MSPITYFLLFALLFSILSRRRKKTRTAAILQSLKKGNPVMKQAAQKLIGKDCIVETISDKQVTGILQEITDNALILSDPVTPERGPYLVNLDFVTQIRPYPYNKKGKRSTFY